MASGASGPYKGIKSVNLPWEIAVVCIDGDRVDIDTYVALHSTLDYDGLLDLLELRSVQDSWVQAGLLNARIDNGE